MLLRFRGRRPENVPQPTPGVFDRAVEELYGSSRRIVELTILIARAMGMREDELENVQLGALLHDIGMAGVPDEILFKTGSLTKEEREIIKRHPTYALELLSGAPALAAALEIPYCHHEHWNGTGYPRGLKGPEIPLAARIFAVVDVWVALLSERPYRPAWTEEDAHAYILQRAGRDFDPAVVEVFMKLQPPPGL